MVKLSSINRFLVGVVLSVITTLSTVAQTPNTIVVDVYWSPDGEYISYLASDGIHVMDRDGNNNRLLTPPSGFGGWTADSRSIFVIKNNPNEGTLSWWMYAIDGTDAIQFLPQLHSISSLAYSHDGEQISLSAQEAASDPYQIWVGNANGSQLQPLAEYQAYQLSWSNDDTQIVFETLEDDTDNRQVVEVSIGIDGTSDPIIRLLEDGVIALSDNIDLHYATDISYPPATVYIDNIQDNQGATFTINQWVADIVYSELNQRIIYTAYCNLSDVNESFLQGEWSATKQETVTTALYRIDLLTSEQTVLFPCDNGSQISISFSPDGQEILFIWINNQQWNVYRVILNNAQFISLTDE